MSDYEAADLPEALAMARRMQELIPGLVFRGQRDASWEVRSSMVRPGTIPAENLAELDRFLGWSSRTPGLTGLSLEQLVAIAQHYGVPTTFTDWSYSAEVAGFFATDGATASGEGRIYFVDPHDWSEFWSRARAKPFRMFVDNPALSVEVIELPVPDLWRLQRQQGLFLEIPFDHVEYYFPFSSITFPHSAESVEFARARHDTYYPTQRSPLEERLNDYVRHEEHWKRVHSAEWVSVIAGLENIAVSQTTIPRRGDNPRELDWTRLPDESDAYVAPTRQIAVVSSGALSGEEELRRFLRDALLVLAGTSRSHPVSIAGSEDATGGESHLVRIVELAWNGMRWLPYTDSDIADVVARAALRFFLAHGAVAPDTLSAIETAAAAREPDLLAHLGLSSEVVHENVSDAIEYEFGPRSSNGYQRGWCSPDMLDRALSAEATATGRPWLDLQQDGWHPLDIFELDAFVQCWTRALLPSQLAYRSFSETTAQPIYFSPTWIGLFGLP